MKKFRRKVFFGFSYSLSSGDIRVMVLAIAVGALSAKVAINIKGRKETMDALQNASNFSKDTLKKHAEKVFTGAGGSHDWEHTLRVCRLCEHIGPAEGADMDVLITAAYLHDIGRSFQDSSGGAVCHARQGVQMAGPLVKKLPFSDKQKENIIHCIQSHRFRGNNAPKTKEAKVLFDADKLDAIGAVGVARAFLFAGEVGAMLHNHAVDIEDTKPYSKEDTGFREFTVKLCKIKDRLLTAEGKKLAADRHAFMVEFFKRFIQEYEGER